MLETHAYAQSEQEITFFLGYTPFVDLQLGRTMVWRARSVRQELGEIQEKSRFLALLDFRVIKLSWKNAVCVHVTQYLPSVHLKKRNRKKSIQKTIRFLQNIAIHQTKPTKVTETTCSHFLPKKESTTTYKAQSRECSKSWRWIMANTVSQNLFSREMVYPLLFSL